MSKAKYRLRFFFEAGAGTCLWSSSAAAHERFGYPITLQHLPITQNLWRRALHLCHWYDTSLNWENPGEPSPWPAEESARFAAATRNFVTQLRLELSPDFEILDEYTPPGTTSSG